jgi:hypothetical protein
VAERDRATAPAAEAEQTREVARRAGEELERERGRAQAAEREMAAAR